MRPPRPLPLLIPALVVGMGLVALPACQLGEINHVATVTRVEEDGGFWGLVTEDGTRFRPTNLPAEFYREGMQVEFEGFVLDAEREEGEWGIPVRLTEVEVDLMRGD
ncbi:MAG: hypothetical protein R3362_07490 [Rhodothermales bacterium]|nr:hypothetical protein [Rhodothermales bacterium]